MEAVSANEESRMSLMEDLKSNESERLSLQERLEKDSKRPQSRNHKVRHRTDRAPYVERRTLPVPESRHPKAVLPNPTPNSSGAPQILTMHQRIQHSKEVELKFQLAIRDQLMSHGLQSCRGESAGVAKRPRERSPSRNISRCDSQLFHRCEAAPRTA